MKRTVRLATLVFCISLILVSWSSAGLARSVADEPVVEPDFGATAITWNALQGSGGFVLVVSGPNGYRSEQNFPAGMPLAFQAVDATGAPLADGLYQYELRPISNNVLQSRSGGDDGRDAASVRELAARQPQTGLRLATLSGAFTIQNGAILDPSTVEEAQASTQSQQSDSPSGVDAPTDVLHPDDVIIQGSVCVGLDCVNNENFGFDTIRLKENNLRIKFEDTSTGAFPTNDWQLTANDSASGGSSKFSIEDITGAKVPFTVIAGAPTNSFFMDSSGRVGLGTSTPVLNVHVTSGNTPAMRLEQNGTSGFTAQTWDVAGNEAGFFVRDITGGSRLPFRILPGAVSNSLVIDSASEVGVGTFSPSASLHVQRSDGTAKLLVEETSTTIANRDLLSLSNNGAPRIQLVDTKAGGLTWRVGQDGANNWIIDRTDVAMPEFTVTKTGNGIFMGTVTTSGSCNVGCRTKNGSQKAELLSKLPNVPIIEWTTTDTHYSEDESADETVNSIHISPDMAAFKQIYGFGIDGNSIAPLDVATVALAAVQALNEQSQAHSAQISSLQNQISTLEARLADLEAALGVSTPGTDPQSNTSIYVPSVQR